MTHHVKHLFFFVHSIERFFVDIRLKNIRRNITRNAFWVPTFYWEETRHFKSILNLAYLPNMCHGKVWLNPVRLSYYQKPFPFVNHSFRFEDIFRLLSLDVVEKPLEICNFGPTFLKEGSYPKIMGDHFQIWLTSEHAAPKLIEFREWRSNRRTRAKYTGLPCINIGGRNVKCT